MKKLFAVFAVLVGLFLYSIPAAAQSSKERSFEINASIGTTGTSIKNFPAFPRDFSGCLGGEMFIMPKLSMGGEFCHLRSGSVSVDLMGDGNLTPMSVSRNVFVQTTRFYPLDAWHHIRPYGEFGMGLVTNKFNANGQNGYATRFAAGAKIDFKKHHAFGGGIRILWGGHIRSTEKFVSYTYRF